MSSLAAIYRDLMGVQDDGQLRVTSRELLAYMYHKGCWSLVRGMLFAPRLRTCQLPFFLGRHTKILFPRYLHAGHNVAIGDYSYLMCLGRAGVRLGHGVRLREYTWLQVTSQLTNPGEGISIGDHSYVGPHCTLGAGGPIEIGANVTIGAYVDLLAENHRFADRNTLINRQGVVRRGITIRDDCWIGNKAIILDGVTLEQGCVIGAGTVVTKSIPAYSIAVGNPARVIGERQPGAAYAPV